MDSDSITKQDIAIFQKRLLLIRTWFDMSTKELGDYIGVTRQTINNLEHGRARMSKTQYIAINVIFEYVAEKRGITKEYESVMDCLINLIEK